MKAIIFLVAVLVLALAQVAAARELHGPAYDRLEAIANSVVGYPGEEVEVVAEDSDELRLDRDASTAGDETGDAIIVNPSGNEDRLPL